MSARLSLFLFAALLAGACSAMKAPARFAHERHFRSGVRTDCAGCHGVLRGSVAADRAACAICHGTEADERLLHAAPSAGVQAIRFSHETHAGRLDVAGDCAGCHGDVARAAPVLPPMQRCLVCHEKDYEANRCTPCHTQRVLVRTVPRTFMRHGPSWIRTHGMVAGRSREPCLVCHTEASCADCHDTSQTIGVQTRNPDAITAGYVHRGDYVTRHAIESRQEPAACLRCHETASCDGCHVRRGVGAGGVGGRNPHPLGWLGSDTKSASFHGRAARHDVAECAACHDQGPATSCIRCHRAGGIGGTPHRRGSEPAGTTSRAPCRYCHAR